MPSVALSESNFARTFAELIAAGITGGASYDGFIALCAREHGLTLITRDRRAVPTYTALGVSFELIA